MFLVSQNLANYMKFPEDTVFRINLAWVDTIDQLEKSLSNYLDHRIYLDLPVGRTKPPNNSYSIFELENIIKKYENIDYLAISNVESPDDIKNYISIFSKNLTIVPKIESKKGVDGLLEICNALNNKKIIMLDHDDLFADLIKKQVPPSEFINYIRETEIFCRNNSIALLKTRGVVFSDIDKYSYS